jgi:hypothetical protein
MATISGISPTRVHNSARRIPFGGIGRPLTLIVSIVVAYFFSLSDLIRAMKFDTPLSYLGLVPPIAFTLGCEHEVAISNGVMARIVNYIKLDVNETWSTLYWEQRIERGGKLFYQRVVMLYGLQLAPGEKLSGSRSSANNALLLTGLIGQITPQ